MPEAERNRLLRRVDWRFLLPDPAPERIACYSRGDLADAVALVFPNQPQSGCCDLAVLTDPDEATLRTAWDRLRVGGSVYGEWTSFTTAGAVLQALEAAGFTDVDCYRPWRSLHAPTFWIPCGNTAAARLALQGPGRTVLCGARAAGRLLRMRTGLKLALCAIARKADGSRDKPSRHSLLLTGGERSTNKVVRFVFERGDESPAVVVKSARVAEAAGPLAREAAVLRELQRQSPVRGVPMLLKVVNSAPFSIHETAVIGVPVFSRMHRGNYEELALRATDWSVRLAGATGRRVPRSEWRDRLVGRVLENFRHQFGSVIDPALVDQAARELRELPEMPLVREHRDYGPWNVVETPDGALGVVDWESAELHGLPALDLIYFLTYSAFYVEGAFESGAFRECYRKTLDRRTRVGAVTARCLNRYAAALGLDVAALPPLRILTWMLHSASEYARMQADGATQPPEAELRSGLFLALWEEELPGCY